MARASKAEIARRIDDVRPLPVECHSLREIRAATVKGTSWTEAPFGLVKPFRGTYGDPAGNARNAQTSDRVKWTH